jgi:hypothetical protein
MHGAGTTRPDGEFNARALDSSATGGVRFAAAYGSCCIFRKMRYHVIRQLQLPVLLQAFAVIVHAGYSAR